MYFLVGQYLEYIFITRFCAFKICKIIIVLTIFFLFLTNIYNKSKLWKLRSHLSTLDLNAWTIKTLSAFIDIFSKLFTSLRYPVSDHLFFFLSWTILWFNYSCLSFFGAIIEHISSTFTITEFVNFIVIINLFSYKKFKFFNIE